ncbi:MAG TPA: 50S ribosomal protein L17 [Methylomirabilota bacterium]|nr:50S ribosomal protein L17 [Methylomirabilota bacterium]
MKKHVFGRQLKRDANERKALFKNLLTSLVVHERITTTDAKAKAIKGAADKLITKAKKVSSSDNNAYRSLEAYVNHNAVVKLLNDLGPRFVSRQGGYTRIIKVGRRVADNAPQVILEWTEKSTKVAVINPEAKAAKKSVKTQDKKETQVKKIEIKEAEVVIEKPKKAVKKTTKKETK